MLDAPVSGQGKSEAGTKRVSLRSILIWKLGDIPKKGISVFQIYKSRNREVVSICIENY